jgi:predicted ATPase/DNA-binding winged helix-turn-helix (wHTH) protein
MSGELPKRTPRPFAFGPFTLVPERQLLLRGEAPVRIGGRALDILTALVERPGEIVTKRELMARVWPNTIVDEANLKVNVAALRRTLGDGGSNDARYIATVQGRGYRFIAPLTASASSELALASAVATTRRHNLPTATTSIVGRADAIDAVWRDFEVSRLVTIVGAGGIGKTTVALAVAEHAVELFRDGVWLIDLAPLKDPNLTPNAIATAIGVTAHSANMLATLCESLRDRQMLLVLDNCEHIIDAAASCASRILAAAAGVKILATSREPLLVTGERVRRLPGLSTPPPSSHLNVEEALTFSAIQLFVERATDRLETFKLSDADAPTVAEICRRLDGLALAIELAATRIEAFGVGGLLKQLDDRFNLLTGRRAGPERQRALTATLDWSYGLLSASEAALLRAVSVFAGLFDIEGAAAIANVASSRSADALAHLAAKSLLATDVDADRVAYRLLETTRTYCLQHLRSSGEDQEVRRRHAEYMCTMLERASSAWAELPAREWGAVYGRALDDLRWALVWAGQDETNPSLRIRLTVAGILLWNHFSLTEECRIHASQAVAELDTAGLAGTAAEMQLLVWLGGSTMFTQGPLPAAKRAMERALKIAVRIGDSDGHVRCLRLIGVHEIWTGDLDDANRTLQTFAAIAARQVPSAVLEAEVALGIAELLTGQLQSVRQRFDRRHEIDLRDFNDLQSVRYHVRYISDRIVDVGNLLSHAQWLTGSPETAVRTARTIVEHALKTKHHLSLCNALSWVVPVFYWTGLHEECERYISMLDEQSRRHGFEVRRPIVMFYRAALMDAQDNAPASVVDDLDQAIAKFHATSHTARLPYYLGVVADALARRRRFDAAEDTIRAALERARAKNERWCMPELLRIRASILAARSQADEARTVLVEAMAVAHEIGALSWRLRAANDLARLWRDLSRADYARNILLPVFNEFTEGFTTRDLTVAANLLASLNRP